MARFAVSGRASIVGTAALPLVSVYSTAAMAPKLREVHFFNTTATGSFTVALARLPVTGTQGAGLTEQPLNPNTATTAICTAFAGHTATPTGLVNIGPQKTMAAAVGDGVIWTFPDDNGITCPLGTGNGLGLYVPQGTGQLLDYYLMWEE